MPEEPSVAQQRFNKFLDDMNEKSISQSEIAKRTGVPPQYVSDVKAGRRSVTELFARRIEEEFNVPHDWLRGEDSASEPARPLKTATLVKGNRIRLPIFSNPITGEPYSHRLWDGSELEVCGAPVARIILAESPYVLRFGAQDRHGRLRKDDLVLVSQAVSREAEVHVLKTTDKMFLARRIRSAEWEALAPNKSVPQDVSEAGHCIGILWGPLNR